MAFLAVGARRVRSREEIGEYLWPDEAPEKQRSRLRYELSVLRKATSVDLFHTPDNAQIALNDAVGSDVAAFEEALGIAARATQPEQKLASLEAAISLYTGDLLPGVYDDWVLTERDRLRERYGDALAQLCLLTDHLGLVEMGKRYRRELEERFPDRELPLQTMVRETPTPLRSLAAIAAQRFHGREDELRTVKEWLASERQLLTVTGLGGIGKTRLVREAIGSEKQAQFLSLASITDTERLLETIAVAISGTAETDIDSSLNI